MDAPGDLPATQGKRCRAEDLHLALVADKEGVEKRAQSRGHEMKARWDGNHATPVEGEGAAIFSWRAELAEEAKR